MAAIGSGSAEPNKEHAVAPPGQAPMIGTSRRDDIGTLTSLAIGVVIVVGLYFGREVLVPIALAILLSFIAYKLPRGTIASYYPECNVLVPITHHD